MTKLRFSIYFFIFYIIVTILSISFSIIINDFYKKSAVSSMTTLETITLILPVVFYFISYYIFYRVLKKYNTEYCLTKIKYISGLTFYIISIFLFKNLFLLIFWLIFILHKKTSEEFQKD